MDISLLSLVGTGWAACVNPPPHPILCPRWEVKGPVGMMWAPRIPGRACSSPHLPRNVHAAGCCGSQPRPPACMPMLAPAYLPAALPLQPAWSVYTASQSTCSSPAHPVPWFPGNSMTVKAPLDSHLSCRAPAWSPGLVSPVATFLQGPVPFSVAPPFHCHLMVCAASCACLPVWQEQPHRNVALWWVLQGHLTWSRSSRGLPG